MNIQSYDQLFDKNQPIGYIKFLHKNAKLLLSKHSRQYQGLILLGKVGDFELNLAAIFRHFPNLSM